MSDQPEKIFLKVKTPGESNFTLSHFRGVERLSAPFEYSLLMTSSKRTLNFDAFIGQTATVSLKVGEETRSYNGIIGHFEQEDTPFNPLKIQTNYRALLYPKLWLLNFSGQCRIFQNKSALQIIQDVLSEHNIPYLNYVTAAGMQLLDYCVQYNETDFNFISRLMEREGIFYFFQHTESDHTLILADSPAAHTPCPFAASASFQNKAVEDQFMCAVSSCLLAQKIVVRKATLKSYNYLMPQMPLKAPAVGKPFAGGGDLTQYDQIYDHQSRGDALAKVTLQAQELSQKMVSGLSTVPFFLPGYKFQLKGHPREDANIAYVLYEVIHEARISTDKGTEHLYENTYTAFPATVPFKAAQVTPKPSIYGTQTAKVTGKQGEEIYTEEHGRIKVKFHWDPSPHQDETTSCWIRVATLWAGQNWGTLFTPRVGQEVVVSFIDGDPDKPLIVGSVYNGQLCPPYLPAEPTKSTIKSRTSKGEGDPSPGYNELRFEDKRDAEEVYLHAQKDLTFLIEDNWETTLTAGSRTTTLKAQKNTSGDDKLTLVRGNKSLHISKGNYTVELLEGTQSINITQGNYSLRVDDGNISLVSGKGHLSLNVGEGDIEITAGGNIRINGPEVSVSSTRISVEAGQASIQASQISLNAGQISLDAGEVSVNAGGIQLNGAVTIDGQVPVLV